MLRQNGDPKYLSDTSVEVEYSVPMSGISDIMLPPLTVPAAVPGEATAAPSCTDNRWDYGHNY